MSALRRPDGSNPNAGENPRRSWAVLGGGRRARRRRAPVHLVMILRDGLIVGEFERAATEEDLEAA